MGGRQVCLLELVTVTAFIAACGLFIERERQRRLSVKRSPPPRPGIEGNPKLVCPFPRQERGWL